MVLAGKDEIRARPYFVGSGRLCFFAQSCGHESGSLRIRQVVNMAFFKKKNTEENIEAAAQAEWDGSSQESFAGNVAAVVEEVKVKGIENLRTYKRDRYILGIVAIFVGLLFLLWPGQFLSMLAQCVGALLVVSGLVALIMYFTNQERALIGGALVVIGIIIGVIGIWIILHPEVLVGLAPKIIGLILIFSGMTGIGETVTLIRLDYDFWWLTLLLTSITIAVGVVLFVRPMEVASLFARIVGLTFLYDGITSIWITSRISAGVKKAKEAVHQFGQDVAQNLSALGGAAATAAGSAFGSEASENAPRNLLQQRRLQSRHFPRLKNSAPASEAGLTSSELPPRTPTLPRRREMPFPSAAPWKRRWKTRRMTSTTAFSFRNGFKKLHITSVNSSRQGQPCQLFSRIFQTEGHILQFCETQGNLLTHK